MHIRVNSRKYSLSKNQQRSRGLLFSIIFFNSFGPLQFLIILPQGIHKILIRRKIIKQYISMQKSIALKVGEVFMIINKRSEMALQAANKENPEGSLIVQAVPDPQNLNQLWLIDAVHNQQYQIVHAASSLIMDSKSGEIKLRKGEWKPNQLWNIKTHPYEGYFTYYNLVRQADSKAIYFNSVLKYKDINLDNDEMMFRFEPVEDNKLLRRTCFIVSSQSGKVVDVPAASKQGGKKIIQYKKNGRFNQRWIITKSGDSCTIQNLNSLLNLDINGESKSQGTNIIQWQGGKNVWNKSNQLWKFQKKGENLFLIRSMHEKTLTLGVSHLSKQDEAELITLNQSYNYFWRIDGYLEGEGYSTV